MDTVILRMHFIKTIFITSALLLVGCSQTVQTGKESNETVAEVEDNWETYSTQTFTIDYPINWELKTNNAQGIEFVFVSQRIDSLDPYSENIALFVQPVGATSLADYVKQSKNQIETDIELNNAKIIESGDFELDGLLYHKLKFASTIEGNNMLFDQVYAVKNDYAYVLTFSSEEGAYEQMSPLAHKVLNSFRVK